MLKRSSKSKGGQYPRAFKVKAIKRVERGEGVLPVAGDLGVTRKALHDCGDSALIAVAPRAPVAALGDVVGETWKHGAGEAGHGEE